MEHQMTGLLLVGEYVGVRPVCYGQGNPDVAKRGQPVPGFFEVVVKVRVGGGVEFEQRASFSQMDFQSQQPTRVAEQVRTAGFLAGECVAVRVAAKASGKYVNFEAQSVERMVTVEAGSSKVPAAVGSNGA